MSHNADQYVQTTIATYDRIAPDYILTYTDKMQCWEQASMDDFADMLPGSRVLVPGCGDGRHSRYLSRLELAVTSFDLSEGMLAEARRQDVTGDYRKLDLRGMHTLPGPYDGIFATGCLYHLRKSELPAVIAACHDLLVDGGVLYLTMKGGSGERLERKPGPRYPGGKVAIEALTGPRFYAYYQREELFACLTDFEIIREERIGVLHRGFELWLSKSERIPT